MRGDKTPPPCMTTCSDGKIFSFLIHFIVLTELDFMLKSWREAVRNRAVHVTVHREKFLYNKAN
jgi:hypothetical protein